MHSNSLNFKIYQNLKSIICITVFIELIHSLECKQFSELFEDKSYITHWNGSNVHNISKHYVFNEEMV